MTIEQLASFCARRRRRTSSQELTLSACIILSQSSRMSPRPQTSCVKTTTSSLHPLTIGTEGDVRVLWPRFSTRRRDSRSVSSCSTRHTRREDQTAVRVDPPARRVSAARRASAHMTPFATVCIIRLNSSKVITLSLFVSAQFMMSHASFLVRSGVSRRR